MSELRLATLADLDRIAELEAQLFAGEAWSSKLVADELQGEHRFYVALTEQGELIGYAGLFAPSSEGDVQTIAVAPGHQGKGYGRTLLNALIAEARTRGVRELFLEVREDNEVARGLYRSEGFEEIGERPGYYQPGNISAVVMRMRVPAVRAERDSAMRGTHE